MAETARRHVLDYFHAAPDEYCVVFTGNASQALKLVGESYPFGPGSRFLLTFDNHNSVNGIREFARARGAETTYVPVIPPDLASRCRRHRRRTWSGQSQAGTGLFAYPAQSNFSGVQHDLGWIAEAQARGWDVLLDAAAFVPTNRLDLGRWKPDFVVLSFYKMFGYPTGVGALLARWPALSKLTAPLVRRRHDCRRVGRGRPLSSGGGSGSLRGRDRELRESASRRHRARVPRARRHRQHPRPGAGARPAGSSTGCWNCGIPADERW